MARARRKDSEARSGGSEAGTRRAPLDWVSRTSYAGDRQEQFCATGWPGVGSPEERQDLDPRRRQYFYAMRVSNLVTNERAQLVPFNSGNTTFTFQRGTT